MKIANWKFIGLLLVLGLIIIGAQQPFSGRDRSPTSVSAIPLDDEMAGESPAVGDFPRSDRTSSAVIAAEQGSSPLISGNHIVSNFDGSIGSTLSHTMAQESHGDESAPVASVEMNSSVIGRAFPVSTASRDFCSQQETGSASSCSSIEDAFANFSEEPRDNGWAEKMENELREYVGTQEYRYTILALECRSSLCAIEVVSPDGQMLFDPPSSFKQATQLSTIDRFHFRTFRGDKVTFSVFVDEAHHRTHAPQAEVNQ